MTENIYVGGNMVKMYSSIVNAILLTVYKCDRMIKEVGHKNPIHDCRP